MKAIFRGAFGLARAATWFALATTCFGQSGSSLQCTNARELALKLASTIGREGTPLELEPAMWRCAGRGYVILAEDAFEAGELPDASRYVSAAVLMLEAERRNDAALLGALRLQGAILIERGMTTEALEVFARLNALPVLSPEHAATIRGLAGACFQAVGDRAAAERDYLEAIRIWDSIERSHQSVSERSNLGVLYLGDGRFVQAVAVLQRAYSLVDSSSRSESHYRLVVTNNLAVAHAQKGDARHALRYARLAVRLADMSKLGRPQLIASVYSNSAGILRAAGRKQEANELGQRARRAQLLADTVVDFSDLQRKKR